MNSKQQKIKEAYVDAWIIIDFSIQEKILENNGFTYEINESWLQNKMGVELELKDKYCRPKSLQGIENNNGWIKIESENDLPKEEGNYMIFHNQDNMQTSETFSKNIVHKLFKYNSITHYQPIEKPKPPIY